MPKLDQCWQMALTVIRKETNYDSGIKPREFGWPKTTNLYYLIRKPVFLPVSVCPCCFCRKETQTVCCDLCTPVFPTSCSQCFSASFFQ